MFKENIHCDLEVFYEQVDGCPLKDRQFNFFELVYVISGTGMHAVNANTFAFESGDLFLITPSDSHDFDLNGTCEFMVVRFGERYIRGYQWKSMDHIECLLHRASHLPGTLLANTSDRQLIHSLMVNLRQAVQQPLLYNEDLMRHLVDAIIVVCARNIAVTKPAKLADNADTRILQILDYIQQYIRQPNLLKMAVIAEKFGFSPSYLGGYFRRQCEESLQQYVSSYRVKLIEHRLRFSDKRVHEIADEFGFADESHINKFFKRHTGLSLKAYKRERATG